MGRHPSNGLPSFRFNPTEVAEMESILQAHNLQLPAREVFVALAEKFSNSAERAGNIVQMKQVMNWFQNRRYAIRAKAGSVGKAPGELGLPVPQNPTARSVPEASRLLSSCTVQSADRNASDITQMDFEVRSSRDGAWYDVASFLSQRLEAGNLKVLVRFAGLEEEDDEWVNVRTDVRQRSLPCEPTECVAILPGDLILCFQDRKDQSLYFDAHVLDAQRRRHDARGCRCRFLVRYVNDQFEKIVPLKKICRRPETDYRLRQLRGESARVNQKRADAGIKAGSTASVAPVKIEEKQINREAAGVSAEAVVTNNVTQGNNHLENGKDCCVTVSGANASDSDPASGEATALPPQTAETGTTTAPEVSNNSSNNASVAGGSAAEIPSLAAPVEAQSQDPEVSNNSSNNAAVAGGSAAEIPSLAAPVEAQSQE